MCSKNGGDHGTGVYMWKGTTSSMIAANKPYGQFYNFFSVSPEYFGLHPRTVMQSLKLSYDSVCIVPVTELQTHLSISLNIFLSRFLHHSSTQQIMTLKLNKKNFDGTEFKIIYDIFLSCTLQTQNTARCVFCRHSKQMITLT
jgi:hypothetical protein